MENYKRIYPSEEDPKYGLRFMIKGVQFIDIDRNYTPMIDVEEVSIKGNRIFEIGPSWMVWKRNKAKISDALVTSLNASKVQGFKNSRPNFRDVVALKIIYLEIPGKEYVV